MNQSLETGLLSRPLLKDRAKGALCGKYGKFMLAFVTVTLLSNIFEFTVNFIVSILLESLLMASQGAALGLTPEQLLQLTQTDTYTSLLMKWYVPVNYITLAVAQIFTSVFRVGLTLFALNIACNQSTALSDIFYGFRNHFGKALKISAIFVLISQLTQLPATIINYMTMDLKSELPLEQLAILLLIMCVCSIIYVLIYLGFSQAYYLFLDFPGLSAGQLIRQSFLIMKGHKKRFFLLELSFLPLILLSMLTFGLGDLWLTPYMQLTYAFFYLNLMQTRTATAQAQV